MPDKVRTSDVVELLSHIRNDIQAGDHGMGVTEIPVRLHRLPDGTVTFHTGSGDFIDDHRGVITRPVYVTKYDGPSQVLTSAEILIEGLDDA